MVLYSRSGCAMTDQLRNAAYLAGMLIVLMSLLIVTDEQAKALTQPKAKERGSTTEAKESNAVGGKQSAQTPKAGPLSTQRTILITGRVVDKKGVPVAGATVRVGHSGFESTLQKGTYPKHREFGRDTTDHDGRFTVSYVGFPFGQIVAMADGIAPAWLSVQEAAVKDEIELQLERDSEPLTGRVLNLEGQPLAGIQVKLRLLANAEMGGVDHWLEELPSLREKGLLPKSTANGAMERKYGGDVGRFPLKSGLIEKTPGLPHIVVTTEDGRFRFDDLGTDRLAILELSGDTIETTTISVVSRSMPEIQARGLGSNRLLKYNDLGNDKYYGNGCNLVIAPSQPIVGTIRDQDTGEPLKGVRVVPWSVAGSTFADDSRHGAVTDEHGRFRLTGMPKATRNHRSGNSIKLIPHGQPYFNRTIDVPLAPGLDGIRLDLRMKRGVWVKGRLTDRQNGQPIKYATFNYFPLLSNPQAELHPNFDPLVEGPIFANERFRTEENGIFRIVALPGEGIVAARCGAPSKSYQLGFGADQIETFETYDRCDPKWFHSLQLVDIPLNAREYECNLEVDSGQRLEFELFDTEGEPLTGAMWRGLKTAGAWRGSVNGNRAILESMVADRSRVVIFYHPHRLLAKAITIRGVPDDLTARKVQLLPCGTITGRVLSDGLVPLESATIQASYVKPIVPESMPMISTVQTLGETKVTSEGRFRYVGIFPELRYDLELESPLNPRVRIVEDLPVGPGETIDLGNIDATTGKRLSE